MKRKTVKAIKVTAIAGALSCFGPVMTTTAIAQEVKVSDASTPPTAAQMDAYRKQITEQQKAMELQSQSLKKLEAALKQQSARIKSLEYRMGQSVEPHVVPAVARKTQDGEDTGSQAVRQAANETTSSPEPTPVGQAPAEQPRPQVQILPDLGGVLTPKGKLLVEPSLEFDHTSTNQLTFRGISIVQGLLIGVIDASDIRGDTFVGALTGRYGVSNRLEAEVKVPFLYRRNTEVDTPATSNAQPFKTTSTGHGLGDVELAAHYQLNNGRNDWPVFVANLRYKSDTGNGPFDVAIDSATGVAQELPTDSGFNAILPSLTFIYPSDPVVFFGNIEYGHSFSKSINKAIANTCGPQNNQPCLIGKVTPGDSIGLTLGMSIAVNEKASFSLGYQHNYIDGTTVSINGQNTRSDSLQAGALLVGAAYQVSPRVGINFSTQIGVTTDAPDVRVMVRVPIMFDLF